MKALRKIKANSYHLEGVTLHIITYIMTQFIEITDLENNTFLVNVDHIVFAKQVIGRTNQVELIIRTPNELRTLLIQANYKSFLANYTVR